MVYKKKALPAKRNKKKVKVTKRKKPTKMKRTYNA